MIREALARRGWTHDALAAHYRAKGLSAPSGNYVSRMFSDDPEQRKNCSLRHLCALPDDVKDDVIRDCAAARGMHCAERLEPAAAKRALINSLASILFDEGNVARERVA